MATEASLQEQQSSLFARLLFAYVCYRIAGKMPVAAGIAFASFPVLEASFNSARNPNASQV